MTRNFGAESEWWEETQHGSHDKSTFRVSRMAAVIALCFIVRNAAAQMAFNTPANAENQKCVALLQLSLESAPGGPGVITSARLVEVPANGLEQWPTTTSGYGKMGAPITTSIQQYCDVIGYVSPQNKFELKLPPPSDWNGNFFLRACGGFCGYLESRLCNSALARGYASARQCSGI